MWLHLERNSEHTIAFCLVVGLGLGLKLGLDLASGL